MRKPKSTKARIRAAFDAKRLRRTCTMPERDFAGFYGMDTTTIERERDGENYYHFKDNGSSVLAVAHLDTVVFPDERQCNFVTTEAGMVVFSGALDDRLGAYIILELLPALGIQYDILLTVGEESGNSTAQHFAADKEYDWIIEFDRGGTDVVLYQYEDDEMVDLVRQTGAHVAQGIFSDISYMEHVGVKAMNWGVGYQEYHGDRSHAFLEDTFKMVDHYITFHDLNQGIQFPHEEDPRGFGGWWGGYSRPHEHAHGADQSSWQEGEDGLWGRVSDAELERINDDGLWPQG